MKKNYCFFSAQYLPHLGGVERYTYNLAKTLIHHGNNVIVVTSNLGNMNYHEISEGIEIYRVNCLNLMDGRYPILKKDKLYKRTMQTLKRKKIDSVIVNTRFYLHSLIGMKFAYVNSIPCITIEHGTSHLTVHNKFLDFCGSIFEHCLTKIDYKYCKNYYGVSLACNEWLKHFNIEAKGVIYNSIDVDEVNNYLNDLLVSYRDKYNIPKGAVTIGFTGRLIEEKGILELINVVKRINKNGGNIYLFIAGDGDLLSTISMEKNEKIILLGRIDNREVISLLKDIDIFCLPSVSEGFSTSILEAVACKCYVITTARGGAKEILLDDSYGTIIKNNSESLLYSALCNVINNKNLRKIGIDKSYKELVSNFTWENAAKKVEDIFNIPDGRKD